MNRQDGPHPVRAGGMIGLAIGGLGASAVMSQLALMRELLAAFSGNELVLGIALGSWLLLTGLGAALGRLFARPAGDPQPPSTPRAGFGPPLLAAGLLWIALAPLAQVLAVRGLRDAVFPPGAVAGVAGTVTSCLGVLAPFCLVSGALLTLACALVARAGDRRAVGRVYIADTIGSIAGGATFTFVLVGRADHFALLCWPALLNLGLGAAVAFLAGHRALAAMATGIAVLLAVVAASTDMDARSTQWQHRGEVVHRSNSPYGRLVATREAGQLTFFENGVPIFHTENTAHVEETAHYAMSQRPGARRVLLIGGGAAGVAQEVRRHSVPEISCIELDPRTIHAARQLVPENFAGPNIVTIATDGRRHVERTRDRFDVIVIDLPDPSTWQMNRFFTTEFHRAVKRVLTPDGVLAFGLGRYENYVSPTLARLLASTHKTLRGTFRHVQMIPGGRVYFLASEGPLHLDIAARLEPLGLRLKLVHRDYLDAMLAPDRLADLMRAAEQPAEINTDFNPVLYHRYLQHWLSQFPIAGGLLAAALALGLGIYFFALPGIPRVVFATGFAASALEMVLLLGFQVFYGSLYQQVGLVVTVFMTGLAIGAWGVTRLDTDPRSAGRGVILLAGGVAFLAILLPFVLPRLGAADALLGVSWPGQVLILALTFVLALLAGAQFPLAGTADEGGAAAIGARLFSADLAGAALGALLVSAWLVPLIGVAGVCLLTAGLNILAALLASRRFRRP